MNKERFVEIRTKELNNFLSAQDISEVLYDYCEEKGMTPSQTELVKQCINAIMHNPITFRNYYAIAVHYFNVKFNICELYSAIDLNLPGGGRRLIKIIP